MPESRNARGIAIRRALECESPLEVSKVIDTITGLSGFSDCPAAAAHLKIVLEEISQFGHIGIIRRAQVDSLLIGQLGQTLNKAEGSNHSLDFALSGIRKGDDVGIATLIQRWLDGFWKEYSLSALGMGEWTQPEAVVRRAARKNTAPPTTLSRQAAVNC